uniref:Adhesin domain-containing protein n=1 Tax=mine drainage metagenome TaxID=410659 RepID=E6Q581_9ZZZZ
MAPTWTRRAVLGSIAALALIGAVTTDPVELRSIPLRGANRVRIEVSGLPLFVSSHRARSGSIRIRLIYTSARPPSIESYHHGGRLELTAIAGGNSVIPFVSANPTHLDVAVPAALPMQIHGFTGAISVVDPAANVAVDNGTGEIAVDGARAGVDLATESGNVRATLASGWRPSTVRLETGDGNVVLHVPANFRGHVVLGAAAGSTSDPLPTSARNAAAPFVWLYSGKGNVAIVVDRS